MDAASSKSTELAFNSQLEFGPTVYKPNQLTTTENQVVLAKENGTFIRLMNPTDLVKLAANLMDRAKIRLNHKTEYENKDEMMKMLASDISKFPGLTDMEIRTAVGMGLNGEFLNGKDTLIAFSASNMVQWIKAYVSTVKAPVMKKALLLEQQAQEKLAPTLAEQNAMLIAGLLDHYEKLKADPSYTFEDFGNAYHDFLKSLDIKLATKKRRFEIYAEETAKMRLRAPSEPFNKADKKSWIKAIEANAARETTNELEALVIINCKKVVLMEYLKECIEFDHDLAEMIQDKCNEL